MRGCGRASGGKRAFWYLPAGPLRAWRLLTVFEAPDRCILLLVAEHTRSANPYQLVYAALGIDEPDQPRTKPACCDSEGQPPIAPDLVERFQQGLRDLNRGLPGEVARWLRGYQRSIRR